MTEKTISKKAQILPEDKREIERLIGYSIDNLDFDQIYDAFVDKFNISFLDNSSESLKQEQLYLDIQNRLLEISFQNSNLEIQEIKKDFKDIDINSNISLINDTKSLLQDIYKSENNFRMNIQKKEMDKKIRNQYKDQYAELLHSIFLNNITCIKDMLNINMEIYKIFPLSIEGNQELRAPIQEINENSYKFDFEYQTEVKIENIDDYNIPIKLKEDNNVYYNCLMDKLKTDIDSYVCEYKHKNDSLQIDIINQVINLTMHKILDDKNNKLKDTEALQIGAYIYLILHPYIYKNKINLSSILRCIKHYTNIAFGNDIISNIIKRKDSLLNKNNIFDKYLNNILLKDNRIMQIILDDFEND